MLVPDFMHEFELGVWKSLFIHLIRIMVAEGAVQALNERYRQVPTFGHSTIRQFSENASSMKKMAARNYEDLLQVCLLSIFTSCSSQLLIISIYDIVCNASI